MMKILVGDIFQSKAQTLVNTVNCVGVMGKGIALEFKKRFPEMFEDYVARCKRGDVRLGQPYVFTRADLPWILNFPTKYHWRALARTEDIQRGLDYLLANYRAWGIKSLAVPPLGAGLGQLEWRIIGPLLYESLAKMAIPVELYAPHGTPADELQLAFLSEGSSSAQLALKAPTPEWITAPWVALLEIMHRIQSQPYHWPIGRIAFQKLAYVASAKGLPLGLEFAKGSYGPFAADLKHITSRLMSNDLILERQFGRMFAITLGPQFERALRSYASDLAQWESIINAVTDLFSRTTTHEAEVIATVLHVASELQANSIKSISESDIVEGVLEWKLRRRPPLEPAEVAYTVRNLAGLKWLDVVPDADEILAYDMAEGT